MLSRLHLGNGLYAAHDGRCLILTKQDPAPLHGRVIHPSNGDLFLDPSMIERLVAFMAKETLV